MEREAKENRVWRDSHSVLVYAINEIRLCYHINQQADSDC